MRAVVMVRPRRHGGAAAAAAPETRGKEVWEQDRVAGELTEVRFWAEGGRERELDGDGEARRSGNGDGGPGPDFGRRRAWPSSWRGRVGSGRGCAALGARNRSGVARGGRRRARRRLELVSARRKREEWRREGRTGSFSASARGRAASGRDGRCVEAHRRPQSPVWRRGGTVPSTGDPLFTRLTISTRI